MIDYLIMHQFPFNTLALIPLSSLVPRPLSLLLHQNPKLQPRPFMHLPHGSFSLPAGIK